VLPPAPTAPETPSVLSAATAIASPDLSPLFNSPSPPLSNAAPKPTAPHPAAYSYIDLNTQQPTNLVLPSGAAPPPALDASLIHADSKQPVNPHTHPHTQMSTASSTITLAAAASVPAPPDHLLSRTPSPAIPSSSHVQPPASNGSGSAIPAPTLGSSADLSDLEPEQEEEVAIEADSIERALQRSTTNLLHHSQLVLPPAPSHTHPVSTAAGLEASQSGLSSAGQSPVKPAAQRFTSASAAEQPLWSAGFNSGLPQASPQPPPPRPALKYGGHKHFMAVQIFLREGTICLSESDSAPAPAPTPAPAPPSATTTSAGASGGSAPPPPPPPPPQFSYPPQTFHVSVRELAVFQVLEHGGLPVTYLTVSAGDITVREYETVCGVWVGGDAASHVIRCVFCL
jgi:hypothetical protein